MKKHLIIGKPIDHTLSPKIHNYWFKNNNIDANYEKLLVKSDELEEIIKKIKNDEIYGMNVTVPYKQSVIPFLEDQSDLAKQTNSVNTIFKKNGKIFGDNTDIYGFEKSITNEEINIKDKSALILGAGGVVSSIILALNNLKVKKIFISNRTLEKAEVIKNRFKNIQILDWGKIKDCDIFINATSIGLNNNEKINFDFNKISGQKIFYDVIYNPLETNFLKKASNLGHKIINGENMFLYQAQKAFHLWHNILPKIDKKLLNFLYND
jgi:shikimate dehydrogenase